MAGRTILACLGAFGLLSVRTPLCAQAASAEEEIPALRGVTVTSAKEATWCVTRDVTPVLDATTRKHLGTVAGGRFFLIERRKRQGRDWEFTGDFTPKGMGKPVMIPFSHVFCLSGLPKNLSETQQAALRRYYELKGEMSARASHLNAKAGSASPHYGELLKAYETFEKKSAQFKRLKAAGKFNADQLRQAQYKLSVMKDKVRDLNAKHKAWKQEHGETAVDPTTDGDYRRLSEQLKEQAEKIPGLAL